MRFLVAAAIAGLLLAPLHANASVPAQPGMTDLSAAKKKVVVKKKKKAPKVQYMRAAPM